MDHNSGSGPLDTSASFAETSSEYFTDVEGTTTGSRTPRQSLERQSTRDDTDAESQLYQDARSFADVSTVSLVPSSYTPSAYASGAGPSQNQIGGRLAPPGAGAGATTFTTDSTPSQATPLNTYSNTSYSSETPARHEEPSTPGIDTPTLRAHEEDPLKTANEVAPSTKADIVASETSATIGKQVGTQEPFPVVTKTDATVPDANKQATATLPEEVRPDGHLAGEHARQVNEDHADTSNNMLGVQQTQTSAAVPVTETAAPADDAAAVAAGAGAAPLEHNDSPSTTVNMNGTGHSSSNGDQAYNEKHAHTGDSEKKGLFGGHKKEKETKKDKKDKKKKNASKEKPEDNPELAHFTPEQKRIILEQTEMGNGGKTATYLDIYKFATKFELFLNFIGIIAAIVSGVVQPLMTLIFGNLTTSFTEYGTRLALGQDTTDARSRLFDEVNKDALYLVYIGIGMLVATYIYMAAWIWTGETTTRRIREGYLRSILRQNVGFFDQIGAGEVTTRITSDVHLIQEGISEKVPITFQCKFRLDPFENCPGFAS